MSADLVERLRALAIIDEVHSDNPLGREAADCIEAFAAESPSRIIAPAECDPSCDDPHCHYSHHPLTMRQAYENARHRLHSAESELAASRKTVEELREGLRETTGILEDISEPAKVDPSVSNITLWSRAIAASRRARTLLQDKEQPHG